MGKRSRNKRREVEFDADQDIFDNPLAARTTSGDAPTPDLDKGGQLGAPTSPTAVFDVEDRAGQPTPAVFDVEDRAGDPKNVDDWGNLSLGGVKTGEVDELIVNWCKNACASFWLDALILFCIVVNTVLLAAAGPATTLTNETLDWMVAADLVLTVIFTAEMVIRIVALGFYDPNGTEPVPRYLNDSWNQMDFFVVITSWLNIVVEATGLQLGVDMSSLRALRIMRVLKAFKSIEGIRLILATIAAAIPHTVNGALARPDVHKRLSGGPWC